MNIFINMTKHEEFNVPKYSLKDMYWLATKVAIATFVVAGIYFQFREVQKEQKSLKDRIEYVNNRIDTKHDQQSETFNTAIENIHPSAIDPIKDDK